MSVRKLLATTLFCLFTTTTLATEAWMYSGRIGGTYIYNSMSQSDLISLLDLRSAQNVSILELDSQLSYNLTDQEFDAEVAFLDQAAELANARGMKAVIYYPTFEVLTKNAINDNGVIAASTFAKDNPDWVQQGIDGTPNVFYGGQEVWVSPGEESAWLSPNSGYKDYFIARVEKLAATDLDGVWLDVPIYLDTGTKWTGAEPAAASDFNAWTIAEGLNGGSGYTVPTTENMSDPRFRAWIKWRHINIANFLNDVRAAAQAVNPEFAVVIENFPLDYFDGTAYGLDGSSIPVEDNFISVWETDSVSNTQAMKWSTPDDFENKIAMLKWGKSVHIDQPSWSFSYGNEPLDAALTMAATVATQNVPFESKTPSMLVTVDSDFRSNWFGYVRDHESELFTQRVPNAGIWYSSSTRDFHDYDTSGKFGLYSVTTPPTTDDTWWAIAASSSVVTAKHVGGYRGMSAAMMRMDIPYTIIHGRDDGPLADASDLDMLILPSVISLSDADASYIRQYVQNGGTLLATGELPGTMDETGVTRTQSAIADLFAFPGAPAARVNQFGDGLVIYRPDIIGTTLFGEQLDENTAKDTLTELEKLVRIHVDEPFTLEDGEDIFADRAIVDDYKHLLYLVNYSGLQLPLVQSVKTVTVHYKAPTGKTVTNVVASTPDSNGLNGFATVTNRGSGIYKITVPVDQFALLEIQMSDAPAENPPTYAGPQFEDPLHQEAAQSGLNFVLNNMRNSALAEPNKFGVYTNLIDNNDSTEIYTNGHNVTGEHMGLLLRTSACMGDETAFNEAYRYARELMYSPLYHVPNWSIDKNAQRPFLFFDDFRNNWLNANAPLDDLRLIHGLIDGYENFGRSDANALADTMFEGLYWTTVTDRTRNANNTLFPQYSGGLLGFAWDWSETDDNSLTPAATATGTGYLGVDLLPVDYQDLGAIAHAAERDHRWDGVLQATTQLLLDSEINLSGLYYNGYRQDGTWTGDFEYQGTRRGEHLKVIQELWTAIHLARVSKTSSDALTNTQKSLAASSAQRSLALFKNFYQTNNRVPEYLKFSGVDVDDCVNNQPANCLARGTESLFDGEARIYAQIARLALLLGDKEFSNQVINEKIISDRVSNTGDPRYGVIGISTTGANDAEAWNVLESVFSICLNAISDDDGPQIENNNPPVANTDAFTTSEETPLNITATQLLANDTDADNDTLIVSGLPSRSSGGNSIELLASGDWQYTPANGFSGADSVSYAISDGRGGNVIGEVTIDVLIVPSSNHLTQSTTILSGTLNYGETQFLTSDDADTYDVNSQSTTNGNVVDWYISGSIANRNEVSRLVATYSGHYSVPNVTQEVFLYNFTSDEWVSFDTRTVGDESDSVVRIDVTVNAQNFIAADGETRLRIRGTQAATPATVWANSMQWQAYRGAALNNPPLAAAVSASTTANTSTTVVLSGTDTDGDALSYTVNSSGLNGTLSGTAPNLTYTPTSGFNGNDTFSYTVNDGVATSAAATVTIAVQAPGLITEISNFASGISINGDLSDWQTLQGFPADPNDVSGANQPLNWQQAWLANDSQDVYLAYNNYGNVATSWGQTIYLDTDSNASTGWQAGLPLGADYVIQGSMLYSYAGDAAGSVWLWDGVGFVGDAYNQTASEFKFSRAAIGNPQTIHIAFVGSNEPYGGTAEDLYPDGIYNTTSDSRFFTYRMASGGNSSPAAIDQNVLTQQEQPINITLSATDPDGDPLTYSITTNPLTGTVQSNGASVTYTPTTGFTGSDFFLFSASDGQSASNDGRVTVDVIPAGGIAALSNPVSSITINGDLADWQGTQSFDADNADQTGALNPVDYINATMAHDNTALYLTYENNSVDIQSIDQWAFNVFIDSDDNSTTGFQPGTSIGSDYLQQGNSLYQYAGNGGDWNWIYRGDVVRSVAGKVAELMIDRSAIGNPQTLKFALVGDNLSIGGNTEDLYPDNFYSTNSAGYLKYTTGNSTAQSQNTLMFAAANALPVSGRQSRLENAVQPNLQLNNNTSSGGGTIDPKWLLAIIGMWLVLLTIRRRLL